MRQVVFPLAAALAVSSLAAGCNQSDQKLQQAEKSADSWDATLALVQRQWNDNHVPPNYVRQLAESAATSLEKDRQSVNQIGTPDAARREQLARRIIIIRDRAQQLRDSAERGGGAS